jgi:hypothetical protein
MKDLIKEFNKKEKDLINIYIRYLRELSEFYLHRGAKVFFRENNVVHWGEGGFGSLIIIYDSKEINKINTDYHSDIKLVKKLDKKMVDGFKEIRFKNINDINYYQ